MKELLGRATAFFRERQSESSLASSRKRVLEFCRRNGVDPSRSAISTREFPRAAYADELEKYPVLRDQ